MTMGQADFEAQVMELWTTTRVPLSRANLIAATKTPRAKLESWLEDMVKAGLLELDSDDDGEIVWKVRGAKRPSSGAETLGDVQKRKSLSHEVDALKSGASLALRAAGVTKGTLEIPQGKKSILASGALSFFFGPIGWLYAAPLKEAIPVIIVYVLISSILPHFLLVYLLGIVNMASALAGVVYAWSYNREGRRMTLLLKDKSELLLPKKR
jgi:hypothetical protein